MKRAVRIALLFLVACCAGSAPRPQHPSAPSDVQVRADSFLEFYNAMLLSLTAEDQEANWASSTDVNDRNGGRRAGADAVFAAFQGSGHVIRTARALLDSYWNFTPTVPEQAAKLTAADYERRRADMAAAIESLRAVAAKGE